MDTMQYSLIAHIKHSYGDPGDRTCRDILGSELDSYYDGWGSDNSEKELIFRRNDEKSMGGHFSDRLCLSEKLFFYHVPKDIVESTRARVAGYDWLRLTIESENEETKQ